MKKFLSLIICLNLVLTSLTPVYAKTVTGSALRYNTVKALNDTKAITDTNTVSPSSYGVAPYYYNGTSTGLPQNNLGSSTSWSGIINGISYSIAHSIRSLGSVVNTVGNNIDTTLGQIYSRLANTNNAIDLVKQSINGLNSNVTSIYTRLGSLVTSNDSINSKLTNIGSDVTNILSAIQSLIFTVPQELIDDVDNINTNSDTDKSRWSWNNTFNTEITLPRYRQNLNGGTSADLTINPSIRSIPNHIWYWLSTMNSSMVYAFRDMTSGVSTSNTQTYLDKDLQPISMGRSSFWRDFRNIGGNINDIVARLGFVFANDTDIQARQDAQNQTQATMTDFIKPSGKSSVSTSNLGDIANMSDGLQDAMNTNVSATSTLSVFGDNENWSWFTQETANAFDTVSNSTNNRLRSKSNSTPYLDAYYEEVNNALGH